MRNGVTLERIEEKMGLHGSPTCALRFEAAKAVLIGTEGQGLPQLFAMIEQMRLQTGGQGLGLASAACDIAEAYAADRRQGGAADAPPVVIAAHPDVARQQLLMRARTEILRAAHLEIAGAMDLARIEPEPSRRENHAHFAGVMLPLIKTFGAETGFEMASAGLQVLGGAGYIRQWPLERYLRDARVMSIYEGTTGMQAIDLLTRRLWRDRGRGFEVMLERAAGELDVAGEGLATVGKEAIVVTDTLIARMRRLESDRETGLYHADSFMRAIWAFVSIWMLARLVSCGALDHDAMTPVLNRLDGELHLHARLCMT